MTKSEYKIDADKLFNSNLVRLNLSLVAYYLASFEVLKIAIIERAREYFVSDIEEIDDEKFEKLKVDFGEAAAESAKTRFNTKVGQYEREVGVKYKDRDVRGLIPTSIWLKNIGALEESDVTALKKIRDHRNKVAPELPHILISTGLGVEADLLAKIRYLLHKVNVFWARNDILLSIETLEEVSLDEVADEEVLAGSEAILELIWRAVNASLEEFSNQER